MDISPYNSNNTKNFRLFSDIPQVCKESPCVLGVDEAGRGPVLGPMVYGIAFCPVEKNSDLKQLGVDDSKQLTEEQRESMLGKLLENKEYVGWAVDVLSPTYISTSMYRRGKYNLNSMSHDTAIGLIRAAMDAGVQVSEVYVDTVGPPEKYQAKLEGIFPSLTITVAKKADSLYPCVSAASICAKVARDHALRDWVFPEGGDVTGPWGSGYPGDPVTKKFLQTSFHPVFGFPGIVRFSWKTAEKIIEERGIKVEWEEVEPEEEENANPSVSQYFVKVEKSSKARAGDKRGVTRMHPYFRQRCLSRVTSF